MVERTEPREQAPQGEVGEVILEGKVAFTVMMLSGPGWVQVQC